MRIIPLVLVGIYSAAVFVYWYGRLFKIGGLWHWRFSRFGGSFYIRRQYQKTLTLTRSEYRVID